MRAAEHRLWERAVEALVDGELGGSRGQAVHCHVRDCPDCAGYAAVLLAVKAALRRRTRTLSTAEPGLAEVEPVDPPSRADR